jgi:hypothetical protein
LNKFSNFNNCSLSLGNQTKNVLTNKLLIANYSSIYKTTGGANTNKFSNLAEKLVKKESLTKYLKFMKIDNLNNKSLVPIAMLFGDKPFLKCLKYLMNLEKTNAEVPVIDNEVLSAYIKDNDTLQLSVSLNTLVPMDFLMAIHKSYSQKIKQNGGHINRLFISRDVPPGNFQIAHRYWEGQSIPNNYYAPLTSYGESNRHHSYINTELQTFPNALDLESTLPFPKGYGIKVEVPDINGSSNTNEVSAIKSDTITSGEDSSSNSVLVLPNSMA